MTGRNVKVGLFTQCQISPKMQGSFQVAWDQNEVISKPVQCDLRCEFVEA